MIEQLQQKNQVMEDEHGKRTTILYQEQEETVESVRQEYTDEINELYAKVDSALE